MQVNKTIEFCFAHRETILRIVTETKKDPGRGKTGGTAGTAKRSDPTCIKAMRNLEEVSCVEVPYGAFLNGKQDIFTLHDPERWVKATDMTLAYFRGKLQAKLIVARYKEGRSREDICTELCISRTTYHVLQNDVFCFATGVAAGLGILPPRR